uniref:Uncharacterized protein n=1 Tax=Vitis vinifera TaxID=29760 RepID=F6H5X6_VITVI
MPKFGSIWLHFLLRKAKEEFGQALCLEVENVVHATRN